LETTNYPDPKDKDWTLYCTNKTTVIMRPLENGKVAISRSFLAKEDQFNKKKGRGIALSRMRNFLPLFKNSGLDFYASKGVGKKTFVIFEVVDIDGINAAEEFLFYKNIIEPKVERFNLQESIKRIN
jgi:hypothetical protein